MTTAKTATATDKKPAGPSPVDTVKVKASLQAARENLNAVVDAEWKIRRSNGLRTLGLVENAITLAEKHLDKAVKQTSPRQAGEATE